MHRTIAIVVLVTGMFLVGCNDKPSTPDKGGSTTSVASSTPESKHSGWWCSEHGIPEKECLMCRENGEELCKKNGDWCEKHEFCKSQCFGCDPKLKERYAVRYREKYGKEPPEVTDNPPGKNPEKK